MHNSEKLPFEELAMPQHTFRYIGQHLAARAVMISAAERHDDAIVAEPHGSRKPGLLYIEGVTE